MSEKKRVAIGTDTNSGIMPELAEKLGIYVLPMPFLVNDKEFFEGVTMTREEFFGELAAGADIKTSQPSPESVISMWDNMLETAEEVIWIPMSSGLSGSCMTAKMLSDDYDGKVHVIDNHRISVTQKQSVLEARAMAEKGMNASEIEEVLNRTAMDSMIYITVDTLKYLKKGGRVTPTAAALASILNIKPVLLIAGEKLDSYAKARGMKAAEEKMLNAIEKDMRERFAGKKCIIKGAYTCGDNDALRWLKKLQINFPEHVISLDPLPLSISTHIGSGATAVVVMAEVPEVGEVQFEFD